MRRATSPFLLVLAVLACGASPAHARVSFHTELPAVALGKEARQARAVDGRIEAYRQKYMKAARAGELDQPTPKKRAREQKLRGLAERVQQKLARSQDDRPILVIVEGPDGAGKSSTMERLRPLFEGARLINEEHWGAPPKDAEQIHWVKRFFDKLPAKRTVMMWDRSYYGRPVYDRHYGFADDASTKQTLEEIRNFEGLLKDKVRIVKFYLDTPGERLAETIGKREVLAPDKLGESDYTSYRDRKAIKRLYRSAIKETGEAVPWHVIDMSDGRFEGREQMLKILDQELGE
jgi:polyphosphate kinase 2 (PPK2 family)